MLMDKTMAMLSGIKFLKKEIPEECNEPQNVEREMHSAFEKVYALLIFCSSGCMFVG
jgi:hypothetical protein